MMKSISRALNTLEDDILEIIKSASSEERELLAQYFERRCMKSESEDTNELLERMIYFARREEVIEHEKKN